MNKGNSAVKILLSMACCSPFVVSAAPHGHAESVAALMASSESNRSVAISALIPDHAFGKQRISKSEGASLRQQKRPVVSLKRGDFTLSPAALIDFQNKPRYSYVQFDRALTMQELRQLRSQGIALKHYIGSHTYLTRLTDKTLQLLQGLDYFYAAAAVAPRDKFHPVFLEKGFDPASFDANSQQLSLTVLLYEAHDSRAVDRVVRNLGGSTDFSAAKSRDVLHINLPLTAVQILANEDTVAWIEGKPAKPTAYNVNAAALSGVDDIQSNHQLDGEGVVLGIWDGGPVDIDHMDLDDANGDPRVVVVDGDPAQPNWHATHVAGTMIGNGDGNENALGMAPSAQMFSYDFFNTGGAASIAEEIETAIATNNIEISNHSWGYCVGWATCGGFTYFNNIELFGNYNIDARQWDAVVVDTNHIIVKSAGNDGNDDFGNQTHRHSWEAGIFTDTHPRDGDAEGFDTISAQGVSKNIITVGALEDTENNITPFSSRGPADDGRIKPDLVADGRNLFSTDLNNQYRNSSGTSMSSPVVSGSVALIYQHFEDTFGIAPTASMMKSLLFTTARDQGLAGPDYTFGWGLLDANAAVDLIDQGGRYFNALTVNDIVEVETMEFIVHPGDESLRVTSVWTDPEQLTTAQQALVNDINIQLIDPDGGVHNPWVLDPTQRNTAATTGINDVDNVEQIVVNSPQSGVWTLNMNAAVLTQAQQVDIVSNVMRYTADSDNDLITDEDELLFGTNPSLADSDGDGLTDYQEVCFDENCLAYSPFPQGRDTNALNSDTDNDNMSDYDEILASRSPILNEPALLVIVNSLLL